MSAKRMHRLALLISAITCFQALANEISEEGACNVPDGQASAKSSALLQMQASRVEDASTKSRMCSYNLQGTQDGTKPCAKLKGKHYISGSVATLDEAGYLQTAQLCCHHEMSLFVRREIQRQGFDICDLSDLHGFVHWYDCDNDEKTYIEMKREIANVMTANCPWLGHLPRCPVKGPNCYHFPPCPATIPPDSMEGALAPLTSQGYAAVALRCCHTEMEQFVRREIGRQGFRICDEGALQGFLHWFDCKDDSQTYDKLKEGIVVARSGLPPMCPWLADVGSTKCPPKGHNCPWIEVPEPLAHRRRVACR